MKLWVLAGGTAVGKSAVAQWIAEREAYEVLSADAMLVYRGMDVGTAKPTRAEREAVRYHGLDCVGPDKEFSVGAWLALARKAISDCDLRGAQMLVTGGTGLYIRTLLGGLDYPPSDPSRRACWQAVEAREGVDGLARALDALCPEALANLADPRNPRRVLRALEIVEQTGKPPVSAPESITKDQAIVGLRRTRADRDARIAARADAMLGGGLFDEVRALLERGIAFSRTAAKAIGYDEPRCVLDGTLALETARERMIVRTRQLAKRQETWFRRQPGVHWIDIGENEPVESVARRVTDAWRQHGPANTSRCADGA